MKGDFSRHTFREANHYSKVGFQQGRAHLDADLNEVQDIQRHRRRAAYADLVGPTGVPFGADDFSLSFTGATGSQVLNLKAGAIFVDGVLVINDADTTYGTQPNGLNPTLPTDSGYYVGYLRVWERHVTWHDDPSLRDTALTGADTTTRSKLVWQLDLLHLGASPVGCGDTPLAYTNLTNLPTGALRARPTVSTDPDPCQDDITTRLDPLENQLYRIEIHNPGDETTASYKWARDNASLLVEWESQGPHSDPTQSFVITVPHLGREPRQFEVGDLVELAGETDARQRTGGRLCEILSIVDHTLELMVVDGGLEVNRNNHGINPTVRRWDGTAPLHTAYLDLGAERVQVAFTAGSYHAGDWWLVPARTLGRAVEWPHANGVPLADARQGPLVRYGKLGILRFDGTDWSVIEDCRPQYRTSSEYLQMQYVGGSGQRGPQRTELLRPLTVAVLNGGVPVPDQVVEFTIGAAGHGGLATASGGPTTHQVRVITSSLGRAEVFWTLGDDAVQSVMARHVRHVGSTVAAPICFEACLDPSFWIVSAEILRISPAATIPIEVAPSEVSDPLETTIAWSNEWADNDWAIRCTLQTTSKLLEWFIHNMEVTLQPEVLTAGPPDIPEGYSTWLRPHGTFTRIDPQPSDTAHGVEEWQLEFLMDLPARQVFSAMPPPGWDARMRVRLPINAPSVTSVAQAGNLEFTFLFDTGDPDPEVLLPDTTFVIPFPPPGTPPTPVPPETVYPEVVPHLGDGILVVPHTYAWPWVVDVNSFPERFGPGGLLLIEVAPSPWPWVVDTNDRPQNLQTDGPIDIDLEPPTGPWIVDTNDKPQNVQTDGPIDIDIDPPTGPWIVDTNDGPQNVQTGGPIDIDVAPPTGTWVVDTNDEPQTLNPGTQLSIPVSFTDTNLVDGAFKPNSLFGPEDSGGCFDVNEPERVFTELGLPLEIQAGLGEPVGSVLGKGPDEHLLSATTSFRTPIYSQAENTTRYLQFSGAPDETGSRMSWLDLGAPGAKWTLALEVEVEDVAYRRFRLYAGALGGWLLQAQQGGASPLVSGASLGLLEIDGIDFTAANSGALWTALVVARPTTILMQFTTGAATLDSFSGYSDTWATRMKLYGAFVINRFLTEEERTNLKTYMASLSESPG